MREKKTEHIGIDGSNIAEVRTKGLRKVEEWVRNVTKREMN
jgi:hypothetical protein